MSTHTDQHQELKANSGSTMKEEPDNAEDLRPFLGDSERKMIEDQYQLIETSVPSTDLEMALSEELKRKTAHIERLSGEVQKLKAFISKRKQSYKRKRKDGDAPTRPLSAYNVFVKDRFSQLAKENEAALKSDEKQAQLKRIPPSSLVASTGNLWKELAAEEKAHYEAMALADKKRYEEQMAAYKPAGQGSPRRSKKTGYNVFFTSYVQQYRQSRVPALPTERGTIARLVGIAWKSLSPEEKQLYEDHAKAVNNTSSSVEAV